MSKTLNLSLGERAAALKLFDAFKGSITTLSVILDDVKQFAINAEEWEQAKLVKTPSADAQTEHWNWDDTIVMKDITVDDTSAQYLKDEITKKSNAGEITLADVALVALEKKL